MLHSTFLGRYFLEVYIPLLIVVVLILLLIICCCSFLFLFYIIRLLLMFVLITTFIPSTTLLTYGCSDTFWYHSCDSIVLFFCCSALISAVLLFCCCWHSIFWVFVVDGICIDLTILFIPNCVGICRWPMLEPDWLHLQYFRLIPLHSLFWRWLLLWYCSLFSFHVDLLFLQCSR